MDAKQLSADMRKHHPTFLHVTVDGDAEKTCIKIGDNQKRWSTAASTAFQLDWTRIDAIAEDGKSLLFRVEKEEEAEDVREAGDLRDLTPTEANLEIMLRAQEMVLKHQSTSLHSLIEGYKSLADVLTGRMAQLERHFADTLDRLREAAMAAGAADGGGDAMALQLVGNMLNNGQGGNAQAPGGNGQTTVPGTGMSLDDVKKALDLVNQARGMNAQTDGKPEPA